MIIKAFNDVPEVANTIVSNHGKDVLDVASMVVGTGGKCFKSNREGIWLGGNTFLEAPFSVDMDGHVIANSADFGGAGYSKIVIFKQAAIPTSISVGDLWFDTDDGNKMYRAGAVGATTIASGKWELVVATSITVFAQNAIPTSLAIGDVWYDTDDNNKPYRAAAVGATTIAAGAWVLLNDLRAADALLKAGASQNLTGDILIGNSNIKIDGANKRILISDGTYDRILIGYQAGGF